MKFNTQNAKIEAITEKTLVLGIDVGSEMHYARAFDHRGIEYTKKPFKFSNTEAGFMALQAWILDLKEKHEKDKVVPGMEPTGHYWFNLGKFLQDNEMKPVLVNPHHVKKSKELDDNNPTKNDRKDPKVIAGLVREGRYMIPYLPDGVYADLRTASNIAAKRWIKKKHPTFDGDVYVENIRCFLDISQEELEKRKCTVNEQDTTALIFSQKHLEALYLQCLMHRRNAMQEIPELKGLSETCNRIYKLQDVDVLFQCLLMDQMDWEEEKLYVQFSTIYLLKQTVKN